MNDWRKSATNSSGLSRKWFASERKESEPSPKCNARASTVQAPLRSVGLKGNEVPGRTRQR